MSARIGVTVLAVWVAMFHPVSLLAQATDPPYLAEMPSVDRVMKAMQASDPDETAARQMGAFTQLKTMIEELAGPRFYKPGLTPDEAKLRQTYYTAYYQISQSKPQYKSLGAMRGYDINPAFRNELIQKVFPPTFAAEYPKLVAQAKGQTQALHNDAEQIRAKNAAAEQAQAQKAFDQAATNFEAQKAAQSPENRAMNRCITSGRLPASCMGNSLLGGFTQMIGQFLPAVAKEPPPGPNMAGVFQGAGGWLLDFVEGGVLVNCSILAPDHHNYTLRFKDNLTALIIDTTPKPLVLTFRADGTIVGPGPLQIDGVVAAGTTPGHTTEGHDETHVVTTQEQHVVNTYERVYGSDPRAQQGGAISAGGGYYDVPATHTENVPTTHTETSHVPGEYVPGTTTFAPRRATCPALNLSSKGAGVGVETMQTNLLKTMVGGDTGPPTPPGIRMHGIFAASTGFSAEFFPESVILGCGPDAARAHPYTVMAEGSRAVIKVAAPDHPLTLAMRPDGSLDAGTGPYQVHGRRITGKNANGDFTFAPLEQTCNLGVLSPAKAIPGGNNTPPNALATFASAAAVTPPAAPGASAPAGASTTPVPSSTSAAILVISSGFRTQPGVANPLAGHPYVLLRDSLANLLAQGGIQVPAGTSPLQFVGNACASRTPECQRISAAVKAGWAAAARADANGKATFPGVAAGTYYLMISTRYNNQPLVWDTPVHLKAGATSLTLDEANASPVK